MPQVFQVLCCYSCEVFQVQFVKKSNKWQCKVCNKKQSLKKAFKIGSAPECRSLVQQLNMERGCRKQNVNVEEKESDDTVKIERHVPDPDEVNEELVDHFSGYSKSEDEMWFENEDCSNNRFYKDSISDHHFETLTNGNNFMEKDTKHFQTSETSSQKNDIISSEIENVKQDKPDFCGNIQKCHEQKKRLYEPYCEISSPTSLQPPLKKNKGFEFIKKAALKLS